MLVVYVCVCMVKKQGSGVLKILYIKFALISIVGFYICIELQFTQGKVAARHLVFTGQVFET